MNIEIKEQNHIGFAAATANDQRARLSTSR